VLGQVSHKAERIALRGLQGYRIVKGEIGVAFRVSDHPGQRGLAALPRPVDEDNGRVRERLQQSGLSETGMKATFSHCVQL
jgi:hypothetical protein